MREDKSMSIFVLAGCMAAVMLAAVLIGYSFGVSASAVKTPPVAAAALQFEESPLIPAPTHTPAPSAQEDIESPITNGSISVPGFEKLTVQGGKLQAGGVTNPARNSCYFIVSLMLADGTEIYRSGILAPGQTVGVVELNKLLVSGTYENAVARYSCYSSENMQPLNGADIAFTLEVLP